MFVRPSMPETCGDDGALLTVSRNSYLPEKMKHFRGPKRQSKLVQAKAGVSSLTFFPFFFYR